MAERNRLSIIIPPSLLYGGILSVATDTSLYIFFDTDVQTMNTGLYFWGHSLLMLLWCSFAYPKLLWAWTCGEFSYLYSNFKLTYQMALLFSFGIQLIDTLLIGFLIKNVKDDFYFGTRLLYTPASTFCALYGFEFLGLNSIVRRILLHDL